MSMRLAPSMTPDTQFFWDGLKNHTLLLVMFMETFLQRDFLQQTLRLINKSFVFSVRVRLQKSSFRFRQVRAQSHARESARTCYFLPSVVTQTTKETNSFIL